MPAQTLKGVAFAGETVKYDDPEDLAYGQSSDRTCVLCFFRNGSDNPTRDCQIQGDMAKRLFGVDLAERMPEQLDGEEVGHYCPYWADWRAE